MRRPTEGSCFTERKQGPRRKKVPVRYDSGALRRAGAGDSRDTSLSPGRRCIGPPSVSSPFSPLALFLSSPVSPPSLASSFFQSPGSPAGASPEGMATPKGNLSILAPVFSCRSMTGQSCADRSP